MKRISGHHPEVRIAPPRRKFITYTAPLEAQLEAVRLAQAKRERRAERLARTVSAGGMK